MGIRSIYPHGHFCWVDLMARDADRAARYYGALFGWTAVDQQANGGPPYTCFELDAHAVGGLGEMTADMKASGMPPVWNSYIKVDDVAAAADRATALGAALMMPPTQIVDAGHMSILRDPTGAFVALWQPIDHCGAQLVNVPNTWIWNDLLTRDPVAAQSFYGGLFDWVFHKEPSPAGDYWIINNGPTMNGGMMTMTAAMEGAPPHWSVYFAVDDIAAALGRVRELGGHVCMEPFEVAVGYIALVVDDQGAASHLIQLTVPADA